MQSQTKPCAEVVESSLTNLVAHCWEHSAIPDFGSLVITSQTDQLAVGVISNITTGSMDPTRYPFPYKKTYEQLQAEHPHIFDFLTTRIEIKLVGHLNAQNSSISYTLPPTPPRIHAFIHPLDQEKEKTFLSSPHFLPLILASQENAHMADELFLALIKRLESLSLLKPELFKIYYQTYSLVVGNDYRRLRLLMQRVTQSFAHLLTTVPN